MTDGKYILESYCGESEPEALSTMLLLLWVSPPSTYILRAVPDGTKSPLNYYEDAFESSGGESDNTPTLVIAGSQDASMSTAPRGFT